MALWLTCPGAPGNSKLLISHPPLGIKSTSGISQGQRLFGVELPDGELADSSVFFGELVHDLEVGSGEVNVGEPHGSLPAWGASRGRCLDERHHARVPLACCRWFRDRELQLFVLHVLCHSSGCC